MRTNNESFPIHQGYVCTAAGTNLLQLSKQNLLRWWTIDASEQRPLWFGLTVDGNRAMNEKTYNH